MGRSSGARQAKRSPACITERVLGAFAAVKAAMQPDDELVALVVRHLEPLMSDENADKRAPLTKCVCT